MEEEEAEMSNCPGQFTGEKCSKNLKARAKMELEIILNQFCNAFFGD